MRRGAVLIAAVTAHTGAAAAQQFVSGCLSPWAGKIEGAFSRALFAPGSKLCLEFDLSGLLRGDVLQRFQAHQLGIQSQILVPNEARKLEGLPPRQGGDQPVLVPGQPGAPGGSTRPPSGAPA